MMPFIIDGELKQKERERIAQAVSIMSGAFARLKKCRDIGEIPANPQEVTMEAINRLADEKKRQCYDSAFLTSDGREKAANEWEKIRIQAEQNVKMIQDFFANYPDAIINYHCSPLECKNIEELAAEAAKIPTPEPAFKHYELIIKARDAVKELQDFERTNKFFQTTLQDSFGMGSDPRRVAWAWIQKAKYEAIKAKHDAFESAALAARKQAEKEIEERTARLAARYDSEHPQEMAKQREKQEAYSLAMRKELEKINGTSTIL